MDKNNDSVFAFCITLILYVGVFFALFIHKEHFIITPNTPSEHTINIALSQIQSAPQTSTQKEYKEIELNKPISKPKKHKTKERDDASNDSNKIMRGNESTQSKEQVAHSQSYDDEYSFLVKKIITKEHKYPPSFSAMGLKGIVKVEFFIDTNGGLLNERVLESSGLETLDKHALKTIKKASRKFPKPQNERVIRTSLRYNLN